MNKIKQHITIEQFKELPEELQTWAVQNVGDGFTIGGMIELLGDKYINALQVKFPHDSSLEEDMAKPNEVCDALWEAVKETLIK